MDMLKLGSNCSCPKYNNFSSFVWREELNESTKLLFQKDRSPLTCFKVICPENVTDSVPSLEHYEFLSFLLLSSVIVSNILLEIIVIIDCNTFS
jgi:hypothetical protein